MTMAEQVGRWPWLSQALHASVVGAPWRGLVLKRTWAIPSEDNGDSRDGAKVSSSGVIKAVSALTVTLLKALGGLINRSGLLAAGLHPVGVLLGVMVLWALLTVAEPFASAVWLWGLGGYTLLTLARYHTTTVHAAGVKIQFTPLDGMVVVFFATMVVSTAFSSLRLESLEGLLKALTFLLAYCIYRVLGQASIVSEADALPQWQRWVLQHANALLCGWLVVLALVQVGIGWQQSHAGVEALATWQDPGIDAQFQMTRVFGTLKPENPNLLAGFLVSMVPVSAWAALAVWQPQTGFFGRLLGRRWEKVLASALAILAFLALAYGVMLTGSRGGYLAIGVALLGGLLGLAHWLWYTGIPRWQAKSFDTGRGVSVWASPRVLRLVLLVGALVLVAGAALAVGLSPKILHRLTSIGAGAEDSSIAYRFHVYRSCWQMLCDNWLVGIGPGNDTFKQVYGYYMVPEFNALSAYSVPFEIAIEQGVLGLLAFVGLLGGVKLQALVLLDNPQLSFGQRLWGWVLFLAIVASVIYGLFDTIWYRPPVQLLFWFWVAAFVTHSQQCAAALQDSSQGTPA